MKTKRELQFLTYLDALENGDAEGISAFLSLAEADAELEKMMMDYHQEENPEEKSKVITPFKRKREDVNHWWRRFGTGLVATIIMILVGATGLIVGRGGLDKPEADLVELLNPTNDPNVLTTPNSPAAFDLFCDAQILSDDNTIRLLVGEDIDRELTVGVNNPFTIMLNDGREREIDGYYAIFEGLHVLISRDSIYLDERCERLRSIQVLPKDNAYRTCEIDIEPVVFPLRDAENNLEPRPIKNWLTLEAPEAGYYPVDGFAFAGQMPSEAVQLSHGCTSFPLLYVPRLQSPDPTTVVLNPSAPVVEIEQLRVREQIFEHGVFFYVEAVEQVWMVVDYEAQDYAWYVSWVTEPWDIGNRNLEAPAGFFPPQSGLFELIWISTGVEDRLLSEAIGWAVTEATSRTTDYDFRLLAGGYRIHEIESSRGDSYSLYERENVVRINED